MERAHCAERTCEPIDRRRSVPNAHKPCVADQDREEFIAQLTSNLPARPDYFLKDAEINRTGAAALSDLPPPSRLAL
jgi:hypothetical protein